MTVESRMRELAERLVDESGEFYYANRHTHEYGIDYVAGMSDAMEQIAVRILAALEEPSDG